MLELINYNMKSSFKSSFLFNSNDLLSYQEIKDNIIFKNTENKNILWPNDSYISSEYSNYGTRFVLNKNVDYNTIPEGVNTSDNLCSYKCIGIPKTLDITCTNLLLENRIGQFSINLKNDKGNSIVLFSFQKFWTSISNSQTKTYSYYGVPNCHDGYWLFRDKINLDWPKTTTEKTFHINFLDYKQYLKNFERTNNTIHISIPPMSMNWSGSFWQYNLYFYIKHLEIKF